MRQYNVIFVIPLILSTIDFALAAPIRGQENRGGDVVPREVITGSEKRAPAGDEELKQAVEYISKMRLGDQQASSSSVPEHGSMSDVQGSSSAPPGPEHESTSDETPNSAPSTENPNPLVEPTSPSSTETSSSGHGSDTEFWTYYNGLDDTRNQEDHVHQPGAVLSQQVNDVAHGTQMDDVQPPTLQENGMANGHHVGDVQQLPVVESLNLSPAEGSVHTATSSEYGSDTDSDSEFLVFWNSLDDYALPESHGYVHQPGAESSQQADDAIHGIQMDGAQPPPPSQVNGAVNWNPVAELPSPWTSISASAEYGSLPQPVYDVAHEPQMDDIHQQQQETGVANGHGLDGAQQPSTDVDRNDYRGLSG